MNIETKVIVNENGELLEILQEEKELEEGQIIVPLSNYYDVLNLGRYPSAIWSFDLKKWIGQGEQRPIIPQQPSEIEILKMEQAKANAEMINLMMSMLGGAM